MLGCLPTLPYRNDTLEKRNSHEGIRLLHTLYIVTKFKLVVIQAFHYRLHLNHLFHILLLKQIYVNLRNIPLFFRLGGINK